MEHVWTITTREVAGRGGVLWSALVYCDDRLVARTGLFATKRAARRRAADIAGAAQVRSRAA